MNLRSTYGKLFSFKPKSTEWFEVERMTFVEKPELTTTIYTPPSFIQDHIRSDDGSIKDYMVGFSYLDSVCNDTISGSVLSGASRIGYSYNSISTPTLPKRLYIGIVSNMDIGLEGATTPHEVSISQKSRTFARIDSCVLTVNGTRSLVGARAEELYKMSIENGLERTYNEALYLCGAPLIVDCRKDCSLANMLVGNSDSCNIGVDINFTNLHTTTQNDFKLVVLAEYDSVLIHEKGNFTFQHANVVSSLSGLSVSDIKPHNSDFYQSDGIYLGGGIFGDIKDGLASAGKWVINHAPQIGSAIKTGVDVVRTIRGGKNEMIGGSTLKDTRFR
jgi:hypothetical protein